MRAPPGRGSTGIAGQLLWVLHHLAAHRKPLPSRAELAELLGTRGSLTMPFRRLELRGDLLVRREKVGHRGVAVVELADGRILRERLPR